MLSTTEIKIAIEGGREKRRDEIEVDRREVGETITKRRVSDWCYLSAFADENTTSGTRW